MTEQTNRNLYLKLLDTSGIVLTESWQEMAPDGETKHLRQERAFTNWLDARAYLNLLFGTPE